MNPIRVQFQFTLNELRRNSAAFNKAVSRGSVLPQCIGGGIMVICIVAVLWQGSPLKSVILPFVAGASLVSVCWASAAQPQEATASPERLVSTVTTYLNTGRLHEAVALFHPDALARVQKMAVHIAKTPRGPDELRQFLGMFGASSIGDLESLPAEKVALVMLNIAEAQKPAVMKAITSAASYRSIGSVRDGDMAFVVIICTSSIEGTEKKSVVSSAAKFDGARWLYVGAEI
jgi:hypothetical protein